MPQINRADNGRISLLILISYLAIFMHIYLPDMGGSGLALPQNIIAWIVITFFILAVCLHILHYRQLVVSPLLLWAIVALVLMLLPWLWTSSSLWRQHALARMAGLTGALLFLMALVQIPVTARRRRLLLLAILLSGLAETLLGTIQVYFPRLAFQLMEFHSASPYGIFQQRNLYGSFLATGCGVALWLALTTSSHVKRGLYLLSLFPLSALLLLTQSRIAATGACCMLLLTGLAEYKHALRSRRAFCGRLLFLFTLGLWLTGVSLYGMPNRKEPDFAHTGSTHQRIVIIKGALALIEKHPVRGSGLGSFESLFPQALQEKGLHSQESKTITHPHNEWLYTEAEGGIVALVGLLLLSGLWLWPVYRCFRQGALHEAESGKVAPWLLPLMSLPVGLHLMTEYPLYQSVPHLMVLLLLFRLGLPETDLQQYLRPLKNQQLWLARGVMLPGVALGTAILAVLAAGLITQYQLTRMERMLLQQQAVKLPEPGWQTLAESERLDYDWHIATLMQLNQQQMSPDTEEFVRWGHRWLAVHNDIAVSAALMDIAAWHGNWLEVERLRRQARRVFVSEPEFSPQK